LPFTIDELNVAISTLKRRKASEGDGIFNEFLIYADEAMHFQLLQLMNLVWETGKLPHSFLKSIIVPVFKGGDHSTTDQLLLHLAFANSLRVWL
jgi:hypothetical protein